MKKTLTSPTPTYLAQRRMEGKNLAYYLAAADASFWDEHWKSYLSPEFYQAAENGSLAPYTEVFTRYLPKSGKIIEAGCGLGQYVLALQKRGYDVEGVDFSPETVAAVRAIRPDLPINVGDVCNLDVPDNTYAGYISLGVMEHRQAGPEPFLQEAYRVLQPKGVAFINVPHLHLLRKIKARLGLYRGNVDGLAFYQYAYDDNVFEKILNEHGFKLIDTLSTSGRKGVKDEIPFVQHHLQKQDLLGKLMDGCLSHSQFIEHHFGHMMMFVVMKEQ